MCYCCSSLNSSYWLLWIHQIQKWKDHRKSTIQSGSRCQNTSITLGMHMVVYMQLSWLSTYFPKRRSTTIPMTLAAYFQSQTFIMLFWGKLVIQQEKTLIYLMLLILMAMVVLLAVIRRSLLTFCKNCI